MPEASLVLRNARVITMDARQPYARAVAVSGDKVLLAGDEDDAAAVTGARTRVIDCQRKTVVPGFNDAHCHIFSAVRNALSLDLSPASVKSIADIKDLVRAEADKKPPGTWIHGSGYNDFYLAEKRHPTREDLDQVAPRHPVVLAHRSLHASVLNSPALALAGINRETPEPPGGVIGRDPTTGEPNGVLFEMLGYIRERVIPPLSDDEVLKGMRVVSRQCLSLGITSMQDVTVVNNPGRWQALRRLADAGEIKSRVTMMFGVEQLPAFRDMGLSHGSGDDRLRLGGVKIMTSEADGRVYPPQPDLSRTALFVHRAGFPLAFHAVEEDGVAAVITALEYVRSRSPGTGPRHRIEHCSQCPPELLERLSRLKPVIVTQPPFVYYSGERYLATLPARKLKWLYRIGALHRAGLTVAASSDSPVVPNNPLMGVYAAVTRRTGAGQCILPEEAVSAHEALAMYTVNGAVASSEENVKGSIAGGKLADMVVLSADPTAVPPEALKDVRVEMTVIGGEVAWEG